MEVQLYEIFGCFQEEFSVGRGSELLEVKGINTAFIESFFKVVADLWRSSPWKRLRSTDLLGVKVGTKSDWKPLARQPFQCVRFSGARGKCLLLDVLKSEKDALGPDGKPTKAIPETGLLRITLGPETDLFHRVRKMIRSLGLEIAGPSAYPAVEVIYPSKDKSSADRNFLHYRSPHLIELRWLIACLKAVTQVHPALQASNKITGLSHTFEELIQNVELSLPATANGYYLSEDKSTVIVRVTYPPGVTIDDVPKLRTQEGVVDASSSPAISILRQCVSCLKTLLPDRAPRCGGCMTVFYCGQICQKKDWKEIHKHECQKYKGMMGRALGLVIKEFSFPVIDFERPCGWLDQLGLHKKGMWRRLCKCCHSCAYGKLPISSVVDGGLAHAAAWALEPGNYPPDAPVMFSGRKMGSTGTTTSNGADGNNNMFKGRANPASLSDVHTPGVQNKGMLTRSPAKLSTGTGGGPESGNHQTVSSTGSNKLTGIFQQWISAVLSEPSSQTNSSPSPGSLASTDGTFPSNWLNYYRVRSLPFSSPVAAILTYPLTLYYAVTNICASTKSILAKNKEVTIHYLGPQGELDWQPAFVEIGHLLSAFHTGTVHIVMIGPEVPNSLSGEATTLGKRLRITYVQGSYQEEAASLSPPNMVVAFSAGLDRSETWAGDLRIIKQMAVPTFFTDYTESCCMNAKRVLLAAELPLTVPVTPNPFRFPARFQIPYTDLPWYTNGFLFGVNT